MNDRRSHPFGEGAPPRYARLLAGEPDHLVDLNFYLSDTVAPIMQAIVIARICQSGYDQNAENLCRGPLLDDDHPLNRPVSAHGVSRRAGADSNMDARERRVVERLIIL